MAWPQSTVTRISGFMLVSLWFHHGQAAFKGNDA
jgi:hypothetical protein